MSAARDEKKRRRENVGEEECNDEKTYRERGRERVRNLEPGCCVLIYGKCTLHGQVRTPGSTQHRQEHSPSSCSSSRRTKPTLKRPEAQKVARDSKKRARLTPSGSETAVAPTGIDVMAASPAMWVWSPRTM